MATTACVESLCSTDSTTDHRVVTEVGRSAHFARVLRAIASWLEVFIRRASGPMLAPVIERPKTGSAYHFISATVRPAGMNGITCSL